MPQRGKRFEPRFPACSTGAWPTLTSRRSFKVSDLDDTLGDAYSYGVSFLRETGYFRREERFWTDQDFPNAKAVSDRIEAK